MKHYFKSFSLVFGIAVLLSLPIILWAAFPGITHSQFQNFESCTNASAPTSGCLGTSDDTATGHWNVNNPNSIITVQSGAQGTETGTSGTHGYQWSGNPSTQTGDNITYCFDATCTFSTSKATVSLGFFYRTIACTVNSEECAHTVIFGNNAQGDRVRISDERSSFDNLRSLRLSPCDTNVTGCRVQVSDTTGYWVAFEYIASGTQQLKVYDTSYTLLGSATCALTAGPPSQCPGFTQNTDQIVFGNDLGASTVTKTFFADDIVMDYSASPVFPLLPSVTTLPPGQFPRIIGMNKDLSPGQALALWMSPIYRYRAFGGGEVWKGQPVR